MTISEAHVVFENLITKTQNKSEQTIYRRFITLLVSLNNKGLSESSLIEIEHQLDRLNLLVTPKNRKEYYTQKLSVFVCYLRNEFSFVTKGYYTGQGIILGMMSGVGIGLLLGVIIGQGKGIAIGLSLGASLGMSFGIIVGITHDLEAKKQNRFL